ncbi:MAG: glycoside hydrolase family 16 protein, partial [Clostridia bacterium]|nr:glycoside hydrolase family 16 protein [Clostridia bacterium]
TVDMSKFTLTWSDEFDGDSVDSSKWAPDWWVTMRKGGYWHEDMAKAENGNLVISAQYLDTPLENRYYDKWHEQISFDEYKPGYYSAVLTTNGKFEQCYGYYEVRCILPAGTGLWSAFWMMNEGVYNIDGAGNDGTEVDIFESMYYKDHWWGGDAVISGIVFDGYGEARQGDSIGKFFIENDPYKEYNTYGLEWNEDEYIFYINGHETGRLSKGGVSDNPEYLLLSVEIAGHDGIADADRHGTGKITHTPEKNWPVEFKVDYVRCYQYNDLV